MLAGKVGWARLLSLISSGGLKKGDAREAKTKNDGCHPDVKVVLCVLVRACESSAALRTVPPRRCCCGGSKRFEDLSGLFFGNFWKQYHTDPHSDPHSVRSVRSHCRTWCFSLCLCHVTAEAEAPQQRETEDAKTVGDVSRVRHVRLSLPPFSQGARLPSRRVPSPLAASLGVFPPPRHALFIPPVCKAAGRGGNVVQAVGEGRLIRVDNRRANKAYVARAVRVVPLGET